MNGSFVSYLWSTSVVITKPHYVQYDDDVLMTHGQLSRVYNCTLAAHVHSCTPSILSCGVTLNL